MNIIQIGHSGSQRFNPCCWTVFSASHTDINTLGSLETSSNLIIHFWRALAEIGPFLGLICETMLISTFSTPDYSGTGSCRIKTGMRTMTFVCITELSMNLRVDLCENGKLLRTGSCCTTQLINDPELSPIYAKRQPQ